MPLQELKVILFATKASRLAFRCAFAVLAAAALSAPPASAQETDLNPSPAGVADRAAFDVDALPTIVATVDGIEITKYQLIKEATGAQQQLAELGDVRPMDEALYSGALDQLIAGILLHAEAGELGLAVTEEELDQHLEELKSNFPSEDEFIAFLAQSNQSQDELRIEREQKLSIENLIAEKIKPGFTVTEEELRELYELSIESMGLPERIKLRHILLNVAPDAPAEQRIVAEARARALLQQIQAGEDFATLARDNSDDATAEQGGELPWINRGQTLPEFEAKIFDLEPGELAGPLETSLGFHVVECQDKEAARTASFEEVRERLELVIRERQVPAALHARVDRLKLDAQIERAIP